ncbi:MAG: hypothetical protein ACOC5G_03180 [Acidobacteriota bacterium]
MKPIRIINKYAGKGMEDTDWEPHLTTPFSDVLELWEQFCFHLAQFIHENWPGGIKSGF